MVDWGGAAAPLGTAALAIEGQVFELWDRCRQGAIDRATLQQELDPLRLALRDLLLDGSTSEHAKAAGRSTELLRLWPALWSFARYPGVEPTNNAAEQALRPVVRWRKGSFGTPSPAGSRCAERLLILRPDSGRARPAGNRAGTCSAFSSPPIKPPASGCSRHPSSPPAGVG